MRTKEIKLYPYEPDKNIIVQFWEKFCENLSTSEKIKFGLNLNKILKGFVEKNPEYLEKYFTPEIPGYENIKKKWDIGIHTWAGYPAKIWPQEKWIYLVKLLKLEGFLIKKLDIDGPDIKGAESNEIPGWDIYFRTMSSCRLVVTNETVGSHAAMALGIPAIVLWGKVIRPEMTIYSNQINIFSPSKCPFEYCNGSVNDKFHRINCPGNCIYGISVDEVYKKVKEFFNVDEKEN